MIWFVDLTRSRTQYDSPHLHVSKTRKNMALCYIHDFTCGLVELFHMCGSKTEYDSSHLHVSKKYGI